MKLRKLYIDNYSMLKNCEINFTDKEGKPLPIIVIAGDNGTGKTTILEFIYNTNFYIGHMDRNSSLEIESNNNISTINNKILKEYNLREKHNEEIAQHKFKQGSEIVVSSMPNHLNCIHYFSDKYNTKKMIYLKATDNDVKDIKKYILEHYRKISRKLDSHKQALQEIQKSINNIFNGMELKFTLDDVNDIKKDDEKVIFKNLGGDTFNIEQLSTGEKTLLTKILLLEFEEIKDKVILIDEPELSLHPSWQNKILKLYENFAKENNCQIIIATHSPHIIGSAKSEWIRILTEDCVVDDFSRSYGFEFDKILTDVMGVENLRTPDVAKKIRELWSLLEDEDYQSSKYLNLYKELENMLGSLDKDLILARLEVSKLKKQNA